MSRRQGAEGFKSNKKARKQAKKDKLRLENTRDERITVIIACEDSVSAPLYFRDLFDRLKKSRTMAVSSFVIATHKHSDPVGVLQDLLDHEKAQKQTFEHRWIVIDRDEERTGGGGHSLENFNEAIIKAHSNKIEVAYSNPCFEIWYLLHFEYRNTPIDRDELFNKLEREHQYQKNRLLSLTQEQHKTAIENAKNLIDSWEKINGKTSPAKDNPSTTIHNLIALLTPTEEVDSK